MQEELQNVVRLEKFKCSSFYNIAVLKWVFAKKNLISTYENISDYGRGDFGRIKFNILQKNKV